MSRRGASLRGTAGFVGQVIAWAVILAAAAIVAVAVVIPRIGGATPYTVLTGSMRPHYPPGTLVVAKPVDPHLLRVGDVVTYQLRSGQDEMVTHRIREISTSMGGELRFRTQGDANNTPDQGWVRPVQIRGRLWYAVPYLGRVNSLFGHARHRVLVDAAAVVLLGYAAVMFLAAARDRIRRRRRDGVGA